jgi:Helix-turn-helix domain
VSIDGWLTVLEAARVLGVHPGTLAMWRMWGQGPKFVKKRRRVYYKETELQRWLSKEGREHEEQNG